MLPPSSFAVDTMGIEVFGHFCVSLEKKGKRFGNLGQVLLSILYFDDHIVAYS